MNYIQYMQTPFAPIMQQDATRVQQMYLVKEIVHPLSQTEGYLAWAAKQSNPNIEKYEKFLQETQKNKSTISQGLEMTQKEKLASQQKLDLYGQLEKEAQDRQKAGEIVLEGINYIQPSYWANRAGANLNSAQSFLFDVVADPTTYLSLGAIPVTKAVGKKAVKEGIEKSAKEAVEKTIKENIEKSTREEIGKTTQVVSSKNIDDMQKAIASAKAISGYMLSPGGAWYERQLANGVARADIDRLAATYRRNLRSMRPVEIMPIAGSNGKTIVQLASDPDLFLPITTIRISQYAPDVKGTMLHELSHAMTHNAEVRAPKNLHYFYKSVLKDNPELFKAMQHNQNLLPLANKSDRNIPVNGLYKETQQEIRARAFAAESDAASKGVDIDTYLNTPELHGRQIKQLLRLYDKESVRNFLKNYKTIVPAIGTAGAVEAALQEDTNFNKSLKQGNVINYINYSK